MNGGMVFGSFLSLPAILKVYFKVMSTRQSSTDSNCAKRGINFALRLTDQ